ncbi:alpha-amylase family glycosyl hydrolase [Aquimarina sp. 2201CG14-23]|uniref:alpha-amylase family glycosyl hydrolase n=1 Tax=Aquimarina mycalae TaxID=3040073 RepID=UPI002477FB8D|nr:alpha-amylase family glycosyl hydrolase [Aquimarina sp. 2201CG14-23]MDH7446510.1 alpha-amylase family glycosyl hydrolase [Aquimarina sp. 2201CG14-23]
MKHLLTTILLVLFSTILACKDDGTKESEKTNIEETETIKPNTSENTPFIWEGANVYFLLADRFKNGDPTNDLVLERANKTGKLRGFEGGDIKGVIQKIEDGYFKKLGINALWINPLVEQVHQSVDEGTGNTYAFHGYWAKDWTNIDPNFGSHEDLKQLVETAHQNDIRILMDVVINHTGPVTDKDPVWSEEWVRTSPQCSYKDYETAVKCTLVKNLPDIKTENDQEVKLPEALISKWQEEGRLESEMDELEIFFAKTGLKRSPKNYIIKWLTDYVRELGIDGYRVDTVKHVEEGVWNVLAEQAKLAFTEWKKNHPDKVLDNNEFFVLGELYGYGIDGKRFYDFGDRKVDYYANGFDNLINFQFKYDAGKLGYEKLYSKYSKALQTSLIGKSVMNYISSHDDGDPFDKERSKTYESATKLLLTPGISQVYYGDETARSLIIEGTEGDATLRSNMNWDDIEKEETAALLEHWQKLGVFRKNHPAIGAGKHKMISETPYIFSRTYSKDTFVDQVVIGLNLRKGTKTIKVNSIFKDGTKLTDAYSGTETIVSDGSVTIKSEHEIVLLEATN